jgi:hypothetical protein
LKKFTQEELKKICEDAYKVGQKSKAEGQKQAVMENPLYIDFVKKSGTEVHVCGDIDVDIAVMRAYHNGYEGNAIDHIDELEKQIISALDEESENSPIPSP